MEHPSVTKQSHADAGAFPLADLCSQFNEQRLDFPPRYIAANRVAEDQSERFPDCRVDLQQGLAYIVVLVYVADLQGADAFFREDGHDHNTMCTIVL